MSRLLMIAGATATGGDPATEHVSAYVVLSDGARSRLFRVHGKKSAPEIEELPAATTIDLRRYGEKLAKDLEGLGPRGAAEASWACEVVRVHLRVDLDT